MALNTASYCLGSVVLVISSSGCGGEELPGWPVAEDLDLAGRQAPVEPLVKRVGYEGAITQQILLEGAVRVIAHEPHCETILLYLIFAGAGTCAIQVSVSVEEDEVLILIL
jgi:hypothetical protein